MTIFGDTILAGVYVTSGTLYTITPELAMTVNVTGVPTYRKHTFHHPFLLMAFEYTVQALCLLLWYIITGGYTPPRIPQYGLNPQQQQDNAENEEANNDDDERLIDIGPGQIQCYDGPGAADGDDDDPINPNGDDDDNDELPEGHIDVRPVNNPAWHQKPVDQTKFNMFLFVVPAFFDLCIYGLLYIAIKLTYNSSYMLIRSAAVLFTVLLRVAFLSKHMAKYMWVSIATVIVGLGLIGMTDFIHKTPTGYDPYGIAAGCLLIVMSQIMIAMRIVYEEKFMDKHSIHPLRVVGLEGVFAMIVALALLIPFSFISAGPFSNLPGSRLVHINDAYLQVKTDYRLGLCVLGRVVSKSVFYYTGTQFVRNQHDAAKRITIDVHHDLIIWFISLGIGWQNNFWPQYIGYILVPIGTLVYCDVIPLPAIFRPPPVPPPAGPLNEQEREQLQMQQRRLERQQRRERGEDVDSDEEEAGREGAGEANHANGNLQIEEQIHDQE